MSYDERAVERATETMVVFLAADTARAHGRPVLAWFLRRFGAFLRETPLE